MISDLVSEAEVDISGSSVRVESAGVFGLTSCEFDRKTGEHLSTTRPYERKVDLLTISGLVPGTIEDVVVPCPRRDESKCESCPNREPKDKGLGSGVSLTPDQVANMQHLHGTMFGWS
ncbi:MAG: hypothetical protein QG623_261 [Patescibacteria group bacterium]|nr:hypothetical protein [Patescibacteria group bacterium]